LCRTINGYTNQIRDETMNSTVEISVVIPVYNNENTLIELARRLSSTLDAISKEYEIIFINDGSRDNSNRILRDIAHKQANFKVITLSRNFGQHPAICAGFEHARGEITVLMDADLQDTPEDIPSLIDKLKDSNADIVYTIKKSGDKLISNRLTSTIYHYIFSKIVKTNVPSNIRTFRAFNRKFLEALLRFKEVNILYGPLMFYLGYQSCFLELPYSDRAHGKSSYTFSKRLQLAVNSLISYTDIPHKISVLFGSLLLAGSFFYSLAVAIQYLVFGSSLPGGSTLILLVLCLTLGSLMMFLGIIGSYIFRVYQEVLNRPRYLVQEKINFTELNE
jgi:polyisoprenyl-phosphate glycosyltransferase